MPNYIDVIGNCFPGSEVWTAGDPTVYGDIVWETAIIDQATLDASECAQGTYVPAEISPPSTVGGYHDVYTFGSNGRSVKNKFLNNGANSYTGSNSAPLALTSGEVVGATISSGGTNNFILQVVANAVTGGSGAFAGGTQIGTNISKPDGVDDHIERPLTGFTFNAGDRISAYIKKGSGTGKAVAPVVRLFIRYD